MASAVLSCKFAVIVENCDWRRERRKKNYEGSAASSPILAKENCKVAKNIHLCEEKRAGTLNALRNVLFK